MYVYKLYKEQLITSDIETVWDFFSSPGNLDIITPKNMGFDIKTPKPLPKMHQDQIIEYTVRPILNLPIFWRTKITEVDDKKSFVDEQIKGPYRLWRHKHTFKETNKGILMSDDLQYALPFGPIGQIAHTIFVKGRLQEIFDYRYEQVDKIFNQLEGIDNGTKASSVQGSSSHKTSINISF